LEYQIGNGIEWIAMAWMGLYGTLEEILLDMDMDGVDSFNVDGVSNTIHFYSLFFGKILSCTYSPLLGWMRNLRVQAGDRQRLTYFFFFSR
jgi:hypothetical protein